jgi:hypothetical protein
MNPYLIFLLCLLTNIVAAQTETHAQLRLSYIDSMRAAVPKLPQPKHPFISKTTAPQPNADSVYIKRDQDVKPLQTRRPQDYSLLLSDLANELLRSLSLR